MHSQQKAEEISVHVNILTTEEKFYSILLSDIEMSLTEKINESM